MDHHAVAPWACYSCTDNQASAWVGSSIGMKPRAYQQACNIAVPFSAAWLNLLASLCACWASSQPRLAIRSQSLDWASRTQAQIRSQPVVGLRARTHGQLPS
ncbi:hypothetical protein ACFX2C_040334 [Malus domestica]